jgi:hypothetical protein
MRTFGYWKLIVILLCFITSAVPGLGFAEGCIVALEGHQPGEAKHVDKAGQRQSVDKHEGKDKPRATLSSRLRGISKSLEKMAAQAKPDPWVDRYIAIGIAGIADAIALGSAWFQRQHNFNSLAPLPHFHYENTFKDEQEKFVIRLRNSGRGPAIIWTFCFVTADRRKKFGSIEELRDHTRHEFSDKAEIRGTVFNRDSVLESAADHPILDVDVSKDTELNKEAFNNFRRSIDVQVEFEDIYRRLFDPLSLRGSSTVRTAPLLKRVFHRLRRRRN